MFQSNDYAQLAARGITVAQAEQQLRQLADGFPFLRLKRAAAIGSGIMAPTAQQHNDYLAAWQDYLSASPQPPTVVKFVPASGAASRMFKDLFAFIDAPYSVPTTDSEQQFFAAIHSFAFFDALDAICQRNEGRDIDTLLAQGEYKTIVANLLTARGMDYGQLPKGLLLFHRYADGVRTPAEEHLVEAARYATVGGVARVHFTVSHAHRDLFRAHLDAVAAKYEAAYGVRYELSFSEQQPATDTLAANADGTPFRNDDGSLLFRPGGHGALIANLNALDADIVFIKNIDNVQFAGAATEYKQLLAGILVSLQATIFAYLRCLDAGAYDDALLAEMLAFVEKVLCCEREGVAALPAAEKSAYLRAQLNRPLRVCGVVRNVGEPGGGPFIAYDAAGVAAPQILEASQIDTNNEEYVQMFRHGTHFNPVDLVCAIRDYRGQPFDLTQYVDQQTGFIAHKSSGGRELKALELPGLWNGAMSNWSTVFVEVPLTTFTPVKTINDLLRAEHCGAADR